MHDAAQGTDAGGILIDRVCEASDRAMGTQMVPLTLSKTSQPAGAPSALLHRRIL